MENPKFKYIKGAVKSGAPADIYFYTDIDNWSADDFLWELKWLVQSEVSKINIHINSAGGTCVDGISVFSRIIDCPVHTACYNDGLAASMASVIWAAGQEVYMKDYALLMIHNPFIDNDTNKVYNQVTEAFSQQLKTIYKRRFGFADEEVEAIMNGEDGNDGTFFTAEQAVERGFIAANHIIETPAAIKGQIQAALKADVGIHNIKAVMSKFVELPRNITPKSKQDNTNIHKTENKMNEKEIAVFAALLGMTGEKATVEAVSAQISAVKAKAEKYDTLKASCDKVNKDLSDTKTELEGARASVKNLTADLDAAKGSLQKYQEAEKAEKARRVNDLVDKAVNDCKIDKADKKTWLKMAESDFSLAESVLATIPARANLGREVAAADKGHAQEGMKSAEDEIKAQVDKIVGSDFKFRKID